MEFLSILTNPANNFDGGMPMKSTDYRALRDGIVTLLARLESLDNLVLSLVSESKHPEWNKKIVSEKNDEIVKKAYDECKTDYGPIKPKRGRPFKVKQNA